MNYKEAGLVHDRHNKQGVSPGCRPIDSHVGDHGLRFSIPRDHHSNLCVCLQPGFNASRPKPPSSHPSSSGRLPRAQAQTLQCCPRTHLHRGEALHATGGGGDPTQPWRESQRYVFCCFSFFGPSLWALFLLAHLLMLPLVLGPAATLALQCLSPSSSVHDTPLLHCVFGWKTVT